MRKKKGSPQVVELCNSLREKLRKEKDIDEVGFLTLCYLDTIKSGIGAASLEKYIGRNELDRLETHQRPDKIALLISYFDNKFSNKEKALMSSNDVDAAFVFDSEVASRVASRPIDDSHGCDNTALSSVYSLFGTHRKIIEIHKASCASYRKAVEPYLEETIRPFLSKWHLPITSQQYNKSEFREDLRSVQAASMDFLEGFRKTFSI